MQSRRHRLDRFISSRTGISRRDVRSVLAQGRVLVDGSVATAINQLVEQFSQVTLDDRVLQANSPVYVMMNKPRGVVSATRDVQHTTVIDLLQRPDRKSLHIAGRLDFNTTGLILLSNDGRWSRQLTMSTQRITKQYRVRLEKPLSEDYINAFAQGMYFAYENIGTRPARLHIISDHVAEVSLIEGRYHQIKRMFGRFNNRVLELHRFAIGNLPMDTNLGLGQSRELTALEVSTIGN